MIEVDRHVKIYGIVPDTNSKNYLEKLLKKMKRKDEMYRNNITLREIKKIESKLK